MKYNDNDIMKFKYPNTLSFHFEALQHRSIAACSIAAFVFWFTALENDFIKLKGLA
jgi:hypothetical protein